MSGTLGDGISQARPIGARYYGGSLNREHANTLRAEPSTDYGIGCSQSKPSLAVLNMDRPLDQGWWSAGDKSQRTYLTNAEILQQINQMIATVKANRQSEKSSGEGSPRPHSAGTRKSAGVTSRSDEPRTTNVKSKEPGAAMASPTDGVQCKETMVLAATLSRGTSPGGDVQAKRQSHQTFPSPKESPPTAPEKVWTAPDSSRTDLQLGGSPERSLVVKSPLYENVSDYDSPDDQHPRCSELRQPMYENISEDECPDSAGLNPAGDYPDHQIISDDESVPETQSGDATTTCCCLLLVETKTGFQCLDCGKASTSLGPTDDGPADRSLGSGSPTTPLEGNHPDDLEDDGLVVPVVVSELKWEGLPHDQTLEAGERPAASFSQSLSDSDSSYETEDSCSYSPPRDRNLLTVPEQVQPPEMTASLSEDLPKESFSNLLSSCSLLPRLSPPKDQGGVSGSTVTSPAVDGPFSTNFSRNDLQPSRRGDQSESSLLPLRTCVMDLQKIAPGVGKRVRKTRFASDCSPIKGKKAAPPGAMSNDDGNDDDVTAFTKKGKALSSISSDDTDDLSDRLDRIHDSKSTSGLSRPTTSAEFGDRVPAPSSKPKSTLSFFQQRSISYPPCPTPAPSALKQIKDSWKEEYIPVPSRRRARRYSGPPEPKPDTDELSAHFAKNAKRRRRRIQKPDTALMKRTKLAAVERTRDIKSHLSKQQSHPVARHYKWKTSVKEVCKMRSRVPSPTSHDDLEWD